MKKLNKILKLSAFTLLCTSSLMAAIGDNMSAGLGVNVGNDVQQQTYLDNYIVDHGNGPLVGVDFQTQFKMMDTGSAVAMLDLRNVYYQKVKTDTLGVGFVYGFKNGGMLAGHRFHVSYDYTWYDKLDFQQVAIGHDADFQGFNTAFNFYVPTGGTQDYNSQLSSTGDIGASQLTGTYGVDFTVGKKFSAVELNAGVTYNFHDDISNNIGALNLGGEYKMNPMLLTGAKYQFRNGELGSNHGYKLYASVPLFRGAQDQGKDKGISAPVKRQLGTTIQYKEEADCSDFGFETYAAYGFSWCSNVAKNPHDGADIKSGATAMATTVNKTNETDGLTVKSGRTVILAGSQTFKFSQVTVNDGATLVLADANIITKNINVGSSTASPTGRPAMVLKAPMFNKIAAKSKIGWRKALGATISGVDNSMFNLQNAIVVQSTEAAISAQTTRTTELAQSFNRSDSLMYTYAELQQYGQTKASVTTDQTSVTDLQSGAAPQMTADSTMQPITVVSPSVTNPVTAEMYTAGNSTSADTLVTARTTTQGSTFQNAVLDVQLLMFGADLNMKECFVNIDGAPWLFRGGVQTIAGSTINVMPMSHNYVMDVANGAHTNFQDNTLILDPSFSSRNDRLNFFFHPSDAEHARGVTRTMDDISVKDASFIAGNTFFISYDTAFSLYNGGDLTGANFGTNAIVVDNKFYVNDSFKISPKDPYRSNISLMGTGLNQPSSIGKSGTSSPISDGRLFGNTVIFKEPGNSTNFNTSDTIKYSMVFGAGNLPLGNYQQMIGSGFSDLNALQRPATGAPYLAPTVGSGITIATKEAAVAESSTANTLPGLNDTNATTPDTSASGSQSRRLVDAQITVNNYSSGTNDQAYKISELNSNARGVADFNAGLPIGGAVTNSIATPVVFQALASSGSLGTGVLNTPATAAGNDGQSVSTVATVSPENNGSSGSALASPLNDLKTSVTIASVADTTQISDDVATAAGVPTQLLSLFGPTVKALTTSAPQFAYAQTVYPSGSLKGTAVNTGASAVASPTTPGGPQQGTFGSILSKHTLLDIDVLVDVLIQTESQGPVYSFFEELVAGTARTTTDY